MKVVQFGFDTPGFQLKADAWHRASVALVGAYMGWQAFVGLLAFAALVDGNLDGACRLGPFCGIFSGMGRALLFLTTIALMSVSVSVVQLLWKLLRALRNRAVWTGLACRVVGIVTAVIGVFGLVFGYGWPWILLGILLAVASQRMSVEGAMQGDEGPWRPPAAGAPPGDAATGDDRGRVIDVDFRDK